MTAKMTLVSLLFIPQMSDEYLPSARLSSFLQQYEDKTINFSSQVDGSWALAWTRGSVLGAYSRGRYEGHLTKICRA